MVWVPTDDNFKKMILNLFNICIPTTQTQSERTATTNVVRQNNEGYRQGVISVMASLRK